MSDVLWWALQPSGLVLMALVLAWLATFARTGHLARGLLTLVLAVWIVAVSVPVPALLAEPLEAIHPVPATLPPSVDGILVLGGAIDWRASVERGQLALNGSGERVLAGAALAQRYPDAVLAMTGVASDAVASDFTDRPDARSLVFGDAFADRRPVLLSASASTYDDALLGLERLQPRPGETWILVTSAWHMPRAWATFRTLGWTTVPYPVDPASAGATWGWRSLPGAARRLAELDQVVREWGAVWVYRRTGRIAPDAWNPPDAGPVADGG